MSSARKHTVWPAEEQIQARIQLAQARHAVPEGTPEQEKAEILWGQLREVAEGGLVYIWHLAKRQFLFVHPDEAFELCWTGRASIQEDQIEGDDYPPPRARPKGHISTIREPKRRRIHTSLHVSVANDAMNCHDDEWPR